MPAETHPRCHGTTDCPCWMAGANAEAAARQPTPRLRPILDYVRAVADQPDITPERLAGSVYAVYGVAPHPEPSPSADAWGWHADGDLCLGPECLNIDEATGDHSTDVHSNDWWEGFTEHGRRARPAADDLGAALDVERVKQAVTNIAVRHGVTKDPPPPNWSLMHFYGYSTTPEKMDAEIAAEYARLSKPDAPEPCPHRYQLGPDRPWQSCVLAAGHDGDHVWDAPEPGGSAS